MITLESGDSDGLAERQRDRPRDARREHAGEHGSTHLSQAIASSFSRFLNLLVGASDARAVSTIVRENDLDHGAMATCNDGVAIKACPRCNNSSTFRAAIPV